MCRRAEEQAGGIDEQLATEFIDIGRQLEPLAQILDSCQETRPQAALLISLGQALGQVATCGALEVARDGVQLLDTVGTQLWACGSTHSHLAEQCQEALTELRQCASRAVADLRRAGLQMETIKHTGHAVSNMLEACEHMDNLLQMLQQSGRKEMQSRATGVFQKCSRAFKQKKGLTVEEIEQWLQLCLDLQAMLPLTSSSARVCCVQAAGATQAAEESTLGWRGAAIAHLSFMRCECVAQDSKLHELAVRWSASCNRVNATHYY